MPIRVTNPGGDIQRGAQSYPLQSQNPTRIADNPACLRDGRLSSPSPQCLRSLALPKIVWRSTVADKTGLCLRRVMSAVMTSILVGNW